MKQRVNYTDIKLPLVLGHSALVTPTNHPDTERVTNTTWAYTSPVVKINTNGFETLNSIYVKV